MTILFHLVRAAGSSEEDLSAGYPAVMLEQIRTMERT